MEKKTIKMHADEIGRTSKVFKTAYYLAKNDRPFNNYQALLELQKSNGTEIGLGLRSRFTAKQIVIHIAREMRKTACDKIIETRRCFSVLIDEATTANNKSPKLQKRLEFEAQQLDVQLKKIGRVLNTSWVASSFRTVSAVWDNCEALAVHFPASSNPT